MENSALAKSFKSGKRRFIFSTVFTLFISVVAFILAEISIRYSRPKVELKRMSDGAVRFAGISSYRTHPYGAFNHLPNISVGSGKTSFSRKSVNSLGFISTPVITAIKPAKTLRIIFIGGSSTAGTGALIVDGLTWPWLTRNIVAEHFQAIGFNVDFINAACSGYTTFESNGRLWSDLRFYEPDTIVIMNAWNDISYLNDFPLQHIRGSGKFEWRGSNMNKAIPYEASWVDPLIQWSQLLSHLRLSLAKKPKGEVSRDKAITSAFNESRLEIFRQNVAHLMSFEKITGTPVFIVKQPTLVVPDLPEKLRKSINYKIHGFDHKTLCKIFAGMYSAIDATVPRSRIIDLRHINGKEKYFFDHIHHTPLACRVIARSVAKALIPPLEKQIKVK
jgi:hypothetical protein